jgi:tRNA (guanine-N7-)-methyltransferase
MNHPLPDDENYRWRNPYIDLSRNLSSRIIVNCSGETSDNDRDNIKQLIDNYDGLIVEIGSGSGQHLIELAKLYPQYCVLGFEVRYKRSVRTIEKSMRTNVPNVFVARTSALNIPNLIPPSAISIVYVNFPDPWSDKRRWYKNRLLTSTTLNMIWQSLVSKGVLRCKTDHRESFMDLLQLLKSDSNCKIQRHTEDLHRSPYVSENILTEFEGMFISQNMPIYFVEASKL